MKKVFTLGPTKQTVHSVILPDLGIWVTRGLTRRVGGCSLYTISKCGCRSVWDAYQWVLVVVWSERAT